MLARDMYEFRDALAAQGVIFCYSGYLTEDTLFGIGSALRKKLELENTDKRRAKDVFAIFIEQIQNVIRYSAEIVGGPPPRVVDELRYGVIAMGVQDGEYFVSCGNKVLTSDVERLRGSLDHIASLDRDGLKALYKKTLRGETPEGSKGAGVGFIDIARKASRGFQFDFCDVDREHAYFVVKAFV